MPMRLVLCACPDIDSAERIAGVLIEDRLAACVSCLPGVRSLYRWRGKLERSSEVQLLIKTAADQVDALVGRIVALHPYELPEVIVVEPDSALPAYAQWVVDQTREES
ncbi:MAG: divalent-cation tolerance protein CutA [Xanthomonadaceae bacterium]|nr:divalent-cation tolerance protein CutA [Xanthomonadaceae bacterium]